MIKQGIYKDLDYGSTGITLVNKYGKAVAWLNDNSGDSITIPSSFSASTKLSTEEPIVTQEELIYFIEEMARKKGL